MAAKKRPVYLRVIAGILAITLIGIIAFIANSFNGNPVSAYFAGKQMAKYVKAKYSGMDLKLSKAQYNFKYAGYTLEASKPGSPDTHFQVVRRSDGNISDGYEDYVLSGFNTIDRLGREMTKEMEPLLKELFKDELMGRCFADLFGKTKDLKDAPPLDTPYNRSMKVNATVYLDFDIENPTLEDISGKIQKADQLLKREGFSVAAYIIEALNRDTKNGYMISVDAELVNDSLAGAMKNTLETNTHNDRLSVSPMGLSR